MVVFDPRYLQKMMLHILQNYPIPLAKAPLFIKDQVSLEYHTGEDQQQGKTRGTRNLPLQL
jgi:hypothetical protein